MMDIRHAIPEDLNQIARIAHAAAWQAYPALLEPGTISQALEEYYSAAALERRLVAGDVLVAEDSGGLVAFAIARRERDCLRLAAVASDPAADGTAAGDALIGAVRELDASLPLCTDILLGNVEGERYHEACGFVPGETVQSEICGQPVVRRRWWLSPARRVAGIGHG
jgi:predicted N-acetyltransferase YhbS